MLLLSIWAILFLHDVIFSRSYALYFLRHDAQLTFAFGLLKKSLYFFFKILRICGLDCKLGLVF